MSKYENVIVFGSVTLTHKIAVLMSALRAGVTVFEKCDPRKKTTVCALCSSSGIAYQSAEFSGELTELLLDRAGGPLLVISAVNRYIFPAATVSHPNIAIINYHNSKLPAHAGMHAEAWQIYEQDTEGGVTWHFVNEGVDAGDIIVQRAIPLDSSITSLRLLKLQNDLAYDLFSGFAGELLKGGVTGTVQSGAPRGAAHLAKDVPNDGLLDLSWSFEKTSAFLRAMDYGLLRTLGDGRIAYNGGVFKWSGYELGAGNADLREASALIDGNDIILHKPGGDVALKNIRKEK